MVQGPLVPVERASFSPEWGRVEEEVAPVGITGGLFGGGLAAGVAGVALSTLTGGLLSKLLLLSGRSMILAWLLSRPLSRRG